MSTAWTLFPLVTMVTMVAMVTWSAALTNASCCLIADAGNAEMLGLVLQAQSYLFIYFYLATFVGFVLISIGHRAAYMYVLRFSFLRSVHVATPVHTHTLG